MTIQRRAAALRTHDDDKNVDFSSADLDPTLQRQHKDKQDDHMKKEREKETEKRRVHEGAHAIAAATATTTGSTFSIQSIIRLVLGCLVTSCALSYFVTGDSLFWGHRPWYTRVDNLRAWFVRHLIFILSFVLFFLLEIFEFLFIKHAGIGGMERSRTGLIIMIIVIFKLYIHIFSLFNFHSLP